MSPLAEHTVAAGQCTEPAKYHDQYGNCTSCEVCHASMCPSDEVAVTVDGDCYHKSCLIARHRQHACQAVLRLQTAMTMLGQVDDEAMLARDDLLIADGTDSDVYDGFFYIDRWAARNRSLIVEAAKTGTWQ